MRYLLDTNVLSEPLRPLPDRGVLRRLQAHAAEIAVAAPVWHELCFGCARLPAGKRHDAIVAYLEGGVFAAFPVLPYDAAAARWHANERARLAAAGRTPPFVDGQIAAIAATQSLTLVTANRADFEAFEGLELADWRSKR